MRKYQFILAFILTALCLMAEPARAQSSRNLDKQIKAAVQDYFVDVLDLSESEIMIEYSEPIVFKRAAPVWDEVQVLPGRRRVRKGAQVIRIGLFLNGELVQRSSGRIRVRTFQNVVVAREGIAKHAVIALNHVVLERKETTRMSHSEVLTTEDVIGFRTRRIVQTGEVIGESMIEAKPMVTRGAAIEIRFVRGTLEIVLPGIARQDGYLGSNIRVKCLETKKIFRGSVLDPKTVIVNL